MQIALRQDSWMRMRETPQTDQKKESGIGVVEPLVLLPCGILRNLANRNFFWNDDEVASSKGECSGFP